MATGAVLRVSAHPPQEETERRDGGEKLHSLQPLPLNKPVLSPPNRIHVFYSARAAAETLSAPNPPTGTETRLQMGSLFLSSQNRLLSLYFSSKK